MDVLRSERSYEIEKYIQEGGENVKKGSRNLYFMGENVSREVYRIPTSLIYFNVENGRFSAERKKKERLLGFQLDATNPEHEKYFIELLLMDESGKRLTSKAKAIMEDLEKRGQLDPGIITHDGFLINGNRRMACLKYLSRTKHDSKFDYILVHVLPPGVPKHELYKLEVQLQIKTDYREKYNPINDLLKIKEGLNYMSRKELAETLGWDIKKVIEYEERLDMIDGFLNYIGEPEDYTKVLEYNEHFVEFQKGLQAMKRAGIENIELECQAYEMFNRALKVNVDGYHKVITQRDHIRYLKDVFIALDEGDSYMYEVLTANLDNPNPSAEEVYNDITAAVELIKMKKANERPVEYLKRAINALSQIPTDDKSIFNEEFMEKLEKIEKIILELKDARKL
jgi:hypothetical protein